MENLLTKKMFPIVFFTVIMFLGMDTKSNAVPLSVFNGWSMFASEDKYLRTNGYLGPGYGGQNFDAEYLFYKIEGNKLSIGLQTGFNVKDGFFKDVYGRKYYTGDLALSFDGNSSNYEYAVDFGFYTEDYYGHKVNGNIIPGLDSAGLYQVKDWNLHILYPEANPYAMESGTKLVNLVDNYGGEGYNTTTSDVDYYYGGPKSYYRIVSFQTNLFNYDNIGAHWTMSCGNDYIDGAVTVPVVPEPGTMLLLGSLSAGLFSFAGLRRRFTN